MGLFISTLFREGQRRWRYTTEQHELAAQDLFVAFGDGDLSTVNRFMVMLLVLTKWPRKRGAWPVSTLASKFPLITVQSSPNLLPRFRIHSD